MDGRFRYSGGLLGGNWVTMGTSAVLQAGTIQILIEAKSKERDAVIISNAAFTLND